MGEAQGEVESDDGVLVIKRIHVRMTLRVEADADRDAIRRAFSRYKPYCPVYRTLSGSIEITDELEVVAA